MVTMLKTSRVEADLGQLMLAELQRLKALEIPGAWVWQLQLALLTAGVRWEQGEFQTAVDQLVEEGVLLADEWSLVLVG